MSYSNIKRFLSAALLVAFTAPSGLAMSDYSYYSDMPAKTSMTLQGSAKLTESDNTITLSLRDSDVKQVLRMFADKANLNIIFHKSVKGKVTLDLVNTSLNEAFNLVVQVAGLNYYTQGNTLIVMDRKDADNSAFSKQEMMTFPVKYVNAAKIAEFLNRNVFGMKRAGLSGVDAATVNSATNELIVFGMPSDVAIVEKVIEQFDKEPYTKTFAVNHTTPAEMANMICQVLLPSRGIKSGAKNTFEDKNSSSGNDKDEDDDFFMPVGATGYAAGILTGFAADEEMPSDGASSGSGGATALKLGEGVVACSASSGATGSISAFDVQNLSIAYFPQRGTITLMGGSEAQAQMIEKFIKANDIKQPQAMLEVSIIELNEQGSKEFNNQWQIQSKAWGLSFDGQSSSGGRPGGIGGNYIDAVDYTWFSPDMTKNPYRDGDGNLVLPEQVARNFKSLMPSTTYITWKMNYLIENRKARVLANPKILITNGQESLIDLTQDYVEKVTSEYLTSTANGQGSSGTAQRNYTIGEDLGIKVTLTPFISPEGYVTLNIKPEYSTVAGEVRTASNVIGQTDLDATLLSRRDLDLKNVRIKDGETLILGGMIQETEQKTVNKIPLLGDLPVIGSIFRSTSTSKAKSELIIMITPKIINDGEGTIADSL